MEFKLSSCYSTEYLNFINDVINHIRSISKNDSTISIAKGLISINDIELVYTDSICRLDIKFCKDSTKLIYRSVHYPTFKYSKTIYETDTCKDLFLTIKNSLNDFNIEFIVWLGQSRKDVHRCFTENQISDFVYELSCRVESLKKQIDYDRVIKIIQTINSYERFINDYGEY